MIKKILRIGAVIIFVSGIFLSRGGIQFLIKGETVEAVGDLSVDFGVPVGNPIFQVSAMAPGETETKSVIVHNDASSNRKVGARGVKTAETGNLSHAFTIVISQNGNDLYGGSHGTKTLAQFFIDSEHPNGIPLSHLAAGQSTTYQFTVHFLESSENQYQAKQVVFDIQIGISVDIPHACENLGLTGKPIYGTQGNDRLIGTQGSDLIVGFEGNDRIDGRGGNDCIVGNEGNDNINGGSGKDSIYGGIGGDTLNGDQADDYIQGDAGQDIIQGGEGEDTLAGGADADRMEGENGKDIISGDAGNDVLRGGNGNDELNGNGGFDIVTGNNGKDICVGEVKNTCEL